MKQIDVPIMGQMYRLGCPEGGEDRLREAVSHVDKEMCTIRDSGKLKARDRIAVLAALNLAYQLSDRAHGVPPANTQGNQQGHTVDAHGAHSVDPAYLDQLIHRLDQALDNDGHLI